MSNEFYYFEKYFMDDINKIQSDINEIKNDVRWIKETFLKETEELKLKCITNEKKVYNLEVKMYGLVITFLIGLIGYFGNLILTYIKTK